MSRMQHRRVIYIAAMATLAGATLFPLVAGVMPPSLQELAEFKTPATAQTVRLEELERVTTARMGYLGIESKVEPGPRLVATAVASNSPAASAGVKPRDIIVRVENQTITTPEALRQLIQSRAPGEYLRLTLSRNGSLVQTNARLASLASVGRPMDLVRLGVRTGLTAGPEGARVLEVVADSPGARAGMQVDDLITKIDGKRVDEPANIGEILTGAAAFQSVKVTVRRDAKEIELRVAIAGSDGPERPAPPGRGRAFNLGARIGAAIARGARGPGAQTGANSSGVLRVAIVGVEFPDMKHNPKISTRDWENEFFSTNSYNGQNATGQATHGSINDFYVEQSAGAMHVAGRMFDWVQVSSNRMDYSSATNTGRGGFYNDNLLLTEALNNLVARDGPNALNGFDAITFLYAGRTATRSDTNLYWPHSAGINFQNRRLRYTITPEGGERMGDISVLCHELGHVFGLPDLYLRRQTAPPAPPVSTNTSIITLSRPTPARSRASPNPYAESLGNWDVMANETGMGRPQHLSAWSKEQLGWLHPVVIDPMVRQKLVLAPVENSTNQCFKIPLRADGSEYLLLENRRHIGFDTSVPGEGLLIWRVVYGRPVLEEAHGLTGPNSARIEPWFIPFPTDRNDSFTPFSKPSSAAFTGDELPVYLTNIRRLPDGRISFWVGYGFD